MSKTQRIKDERSISKNIQIAQVPPFLRTARAFRSRKEKQLTPLPPERRKNLNRGDRGDSARDPIANLRAWERKCRAIQGRLGLRGTRTKRESATAQHTIEEFFKGGILVVRDRNPVAYIYPPWVASAL